MKQQKKAICAILLSLVSPALLACWGPQEHAEIEGLSELEGKLILSFKDAINCQPIQNAKVILGPVQLTTNQLGYAELSMTPFENMMDEQIPLSVKKPEYISFKTDLIVSAGTVLNKRFALSRALAPEKIRFVLQWAEKPKDLDLHLKSHEFHVSFRNKKYIPNKVKLDRDETRGFGPETITLDKIQTGEEYNLWVDNYSGSPNFQGKARVNVYAENRLYKSVPLPNSTRRSIHVLSIKNGKIEILNRPDSHRP